MHHELEKVPPAVRSALLYARDLAIAYCTSAVKPEPLLARVTSELAPLKDEGPQARSREGNLAYLQALSFMAVATENSGPVHSRNTSWLAEAISIATYLNLHQSHSFATGDATDEDSPAKIARRIWLSLIVLDRFHASSTASPLLVAEDSARLATSDEAILGTDLFHLVRKLKIATMFFPPYNKMITMCRYLARARPCIQCVSLPRPRPQSYPSSRASP